MSHSRLRLSDQQLAHEREWTAQHAYSGRAGGCFDFAAAILVSSRGTAATYDWSLPAKFDPAIGRSRPIGGGIVPGTGDYAYVANGGNVAISKPGATCLELTIGDASAESAVVVTGGQLSAGSLNVQNGIYSISGEALASATNAYVGNSGGEGEGSVDETGGTQTISNLYIYNGTYSLGGSGSLSSSNAYLDSNYGNFNQTGGTYNVSDFPVMSRSPRGERIV